jgi:DNA repair ATPase RecN
MTILKYLLIFLALYFISNVVFWGYQEYVNYEDIQSIRSLGNTINIARVTIEEKEQDIKRNRTLVDEKKVKLDKLIIDKKLAQYNELVEEYNDSINDVNTSIEEYEELINLHNENVKIVNELIIKSGTRKYLFPLESYTPELYKEIN